VGGEVRIFGFYDNTQTNKQNKQRHLCACLTLCWWLYSHNSPCPRPCPSNSTLWSITEDGPVLTNLCTLNSNVGTTDTRFDGEAFDWKFEGFCSKAHIKAGTSCMSDSRDTQPFCDWSYHCHSTHSSRIVLCVRALRMRLLS